MVVVVVGVWLCGFFCYHLLYRTHLYVIMFLCGVVFVVVVVVVLLLCLAFGHKHFFDNISRGLGGGGGGRGGCGGGTGNQLVFGGVCVEFFCYCEIHK